MKIQTTKKIIIPGIPRQSIDRNNRVAAKVACEKVLQSCESTGATNLPVHGDHDEIHMMYFGQVIEMLQGGGLWLIKCRTRNTYELSMPPK